MQVLGIGILKKFEIRKLEGIVKENEKLKGI